MNESQWLISTDVQAMLKHLHTIRSTHNSQPSNRKLRLFGAACCRSVWHLLREDSRLALEAVEDECDGHDSSRSSALEGAGADQNEYNAIYQQTIDAMASGLLAGWNATDAVCELTQDIGLGADVEQIFRSVYRACEHGRGHVPNMVGWQNKTAWAAPILREIVGNPFRTMTLPLSWICTLCEGGGRNCPNCGGMGNGCQWLTQTVMTIARSIYDRRAFDELGALADALEDAGCDNEFVVNHLRGYEPCFKDGRLVCFNRPHELVHSRGCWALDIMLGKS